MNDRVNYNKLISLGVGAVVFLLFASVLFGGFFAWIKIEGSEVGVVQDWGGVKQNTLKPGTHIYNNFIEDIYVYPIGTQKITFDSYNNKDAEWPSIQVEVGENGGQKAEVSLSCNYRLNPTKVIEIHNAGIGKSYESVILKREIVDIVNEIARPHASALELYSGAGFVKFKNDVEKALKANDFLVNKGIEIENTIIYQVHLDKNYEAEIAGKQIAQQQKLRKVEETKAAEEEAKRIFAMSQAKVEEVRQQAEARKIVTIKEAEAQAEQQVLQAKAEKEKRILEAEGLRDANIASAAGIKAQGEAEAAVAKLKSASLYEGEGGARRAEVEIQAYRAQQLKALLDKINIMPEKTFAQISKNGGLVYAQDNNNA
jgi:regulator of protease activity HflC (stomatin/prohibitin superfamily)